MSEKKKLTKDSLPEDFTLSLALVDALPVILFGAVMIVIGLKFKSAVFITGAVLCFAGGAGKVLWKILVAAIHRNIWWLFIQMRILMPLGFLLMLLSLVIDRSKIDPGAVFGALISFPSCAFFLLGIAGMVLMGVFAVKLDNSDVKSNWIEQLTNAASQLCFLIGLFLI